MKEKLCPQCNKVVENRHNKFCNKSCAVTYNNIHRKPMSQEQRDKISIAVTKYRREHGQPLTKEQSIENGIKSAKGKHRNKIPDSILELSSRTVSKIIERLNIGCSICGWNEAICDIHHIIFTKNGGDNKHTNLTYICPNCHRLAHAGKINSDQLINLQDYIGDRWKDVYYG